MANVTGNVVLIMLKAIRSVLPPIVELGSRGRIPAADRAALEDIRARGARAAAVKGMVDGQRPDSGRTIRYPIKQCSHLQRVGATSQHDQLSRPTGRGTVYRQGSSVQENRCSP